MKYTSARVGNFVTHPLDLVDNAMVAVPRRRRGWWAGVGRGLHFGVLSCVAGVGVFALGVLPTAGFAAAGVHAGADYFHNLPSQVVDPPLPGRTTIVTSDGTTVAQVFSINRIPVDTPAISKLVRDGVVATEDARFFEHNGVDSKGVARAFAATLSGSGVQGGSTITQQYVKNALLTQAVLDAGGDPDPEAVAAASGRSLLRKAKEMRLAVETEKKLSKDDILTRYLNVSYFGYGAYGVEAAANRYFGVSARTLTLPQAALLSGMLQSPSAYDPVAHPQRALERRAQVLSRMASEGYISAEAAAAAKAAPIGLAMTPAKQGCAVAAPMWGFVCAQALAELKTANWWAPDQARKKWLGAGGLRVTVTVDPRIQQAATAALTRAVPSKHRVANATAVVVPGTGAVAAFASNRSFGSGDGKTEIVLPSTPAFSPGSTFKLFTLAAALEKGIDVSTVLPGGASYTSKKFDNPPGGYHNSEGHGDSDVTVRRATELSLNTAYVQLEEKMSVDQVASMASRFGITSIPTSGPGAPGPKEGSFTLGVRNVSVLEMANAYATIAARGVSCQAHIVASVTTPDAVTATNVPACHQAVSSAVSDTVTSVLSGVVRNGTGRPAALGGRPVAGKTGTAENVSASWFDGFTPQYAQAVWNGDPVSPNRVLKNVLGLDAVYGATLPAQVFKETMSAAHQGLPVRRLPGVDPSYLLASGPPGTSRVLVPDVIGVGADAAAVRLSAAGVPVAARELVDGPAAGAAGTVVSLSVKPGTAVNPGTPVTIFVAR